jgi:hypothetical protein
VTPVDALPRRVDRRVTDPRDRSAARGHALTAHGLECLEEQLRRLRAGDAVPSLDHEERHARRAEGVGPSGIGLRVGGIRI